MRNISLFIFCLGVLFNWSCLENKNRIRDTNSFENVRIIYQTGDEVMHIYSMEIYDSIGVVKAKIKNPKYLKDSLANKVLVTVLNKEKLWQLEDFLVMAKNQKDTCSFLSTSIDRYLISIGTNDSISILGNCDWDGLDYRALERGFFNY